MVVTLVWSNSYAIALISMSILMAAMLFLSCCVCWKGEDDSLRQFYVLSETGMRKANSVVSISGKTNPGRGFFRRFSGNFTSVSILKGGGGRTGSPNQQYFSTKGRSNSENELLDSTNASNEFGDVVLEIDDCNKTRNSIASKIEEEDVVSVLSDDSKRTFYSTYPLTRSTSVAETMRSCLSQIDLDTL